MSAFMVSKAHIDALILTAIAGPADATEHIKAGMWRVWFAPLHDYVTAANASQIGETMMKENLSSVHAVYPRTVENPGDTPGPEEQYWLTEYAYDGRGKRLTILEAMKALRCYEYQSDNHPEWLTSDAAGFVHSFFTSLIVAMPGYETTAWEVEENASQYL